MAAKILTNYRDDNLGNRELAINGGAPAIAEPPPSWPLANSAIRAAIEEAIEDGSWGKYDSRWSTVLIEKMQRRFQCEHVLPCCSGTIAVELALRGTGVGTEHEVIMAGYDFAGNFRAIEAIGAFPVLIDVVHDGWVIDPNQIAAAISPKTAAIIISHLHGQLADIVAIRKIVTDYNSNSANQISIVEDACQAPGGKIDNQPIGSFGDVAAFSFGGSKLLSAGRGGAVISKSAEILQRARIYNSRGNEAFPLSQLQAAVLGPQLDQLDELTIKRNKNALRLIDLLSDVETLVGLKQVIQSGSNKTDPVDAVAAGDAVEASDMANSSGTTMTAYYKLPWLLKDRTTGWSRSDFIRAIQAEGVPIDEGFRGFLRRSPRRCRQIGILVNCQIAAQQTLLLHHPFLLESDESIDLVADAIRKVATASP